MPNFEPSRESSALPVPLLPPGAVAPQRLPPPPQQQPQVANNTNGAAPGPAVLSAQTDLHAGQFEHENPEKAAEKKAEVQAKEPAKGTKAADLAEQKAALQGLPPEELEARRAAAKKEAELFSKQKLEAQTGDGTSGTLGPAEAAKQRVTNARELMIKMEALGIDPASVMDERMLKATNQQQAMVDSLAEQNADLTPEMRKAAEIARAQRSLGDGKVTKGDRADLDEALKAANLTRADLDKLPPEKRLLVAGFSPDEIADHFTARDKDADVINDPSDPSNAKGGNTAARGTAGIQAGGDKNMDGTVRRAMTSVEADRAIDINSVLDESWHEGNKFGKIISQEVTAGAMAGGRAPSVYGDVGELANTELSPDRSRRATGAEQVQAAGLDYNTAPYTNADGTQVKDFVKDDKVHRLEGTIDKDVENKAEVCLGAGVFARAQQRAAGLEQAKNDAAASGATGDDEVFVPKMLRTDAAQDAGDSLPGMMRRTRGDAGGNTVKNPDGTETVRPEMDPRSGLGFSVTERLGQDVMPNQERKMREAVPLAGHVPDAAISRSDTDAPMLELSADGKKMVPKAGLSPQDQAYYADPNFGKNVT